MLIMELALRQSLMVYLPQISSYVYVKFDGMHIYHRYPLMYMQSTYLPFIVCYKNAFGVVGT